MSKKQVLSILNKNTINLENLQDLELLTAEYIAETMALRRNTVSQYLNEFVKEKKAIKIKSRPAYFLHRESFEKLFFPVDRSIYESIDDLLIHSSKGTEKERGESGHDAFDHLIGAHTSLYSAIEQIKSAVCYPGVGLPFLLHGDTGVGKSMLAKKVYEFCKEKQLIESKAPFLELNCAQYYHNPELLSSVLFGYKKGAFTGAVEDQKGLLEEADGGILFLDECHRLSAESQEKLFTFIDQQTFQRIGENNQIRSAQVRLIFATTEDTKKNFLRTFLRRIPIVIQVPSLKERTRQEIEEYIYTFLIRESKKFQKEIIVSPWVMNRLLAFDYQDNVGELKSFIKIICANAYSKQANQKQIYLNAESLDSVQLSRFLEMKEIDVLEKNELHIFLDSKLTDFVHSEGEANHLIVEIFKVFEKFFAQYAQKEISAAYLIEQLTREAVTVIEMFVYEEQQETDSSLELLKNTIKDLVGFLEANYFIRIQGNSIIAITSYLYKRATFYKSLPTLPSQIHQEMLSFISEHMKVEQKIFNAFLELIETKLDVTLNDSEKILLMFYMKGLGLEIKEPETQGVILAHGFSTASSIADVVNRFMNERVFDAFDMPFNVTLDKVEEFMLRYIADKSHAKGMVVLVDMGSLMVLSKKLAPYLQMPLLLLDNVTTQQALFVAEMIKKEMDIEMIGEKIIRHTKINQEIVYPQKEKELLLITACHTGLGAAQQLKKFLETSLPAELNFKVEAVDYGYLKKYGKENSMFKQYAVQGIIGTEDPQVPDIPYVSLEDLISGQVQEEVEVMFKEVSDPTIRKKINDNLVKNLSIERLISAVTILDVKRVISYIEIAIEEMERRFRIRMNNSKKSILYVHIAGLVERSIRNTVTEKKTSEEVFDSSRHSKIMIISQALEEIEIAYNISISVWELNYLYEIIFDE